MLWVYFFLLYIFFPSISKVYLYIIFFPLTQNTFMFLCRKVSCVVVSNVENSFKYVFVFKKNGCSSFITIFQKKNILINWLLKSSNNAFFKEKETKIADRFCKYLLKCIISVWLWSSFLYFFSVYLIFILILCLIIFSVYFYSKYSSYRSKTL